VEEDEEVYKNIMLAYIDEFNHFMNQFEIDLRSGSFLDMDTKLHDKYIGDGSAVDYSKLVSLNLELKLSITKLRQLLSFK
jgi:hypothetical protein